MERNYSSEIQLTSIKQFKDTFFQYKITPNDEIVTLSERYFRIMNMNTGNLVCEIISESMQQFCLIDHTNEVLILNKDEIRVDWHYRYARQHVYNSIKLISQLHEENISIRETHVADRYPVSLAYNRINKKIYYLSDPSTPDIVTLNKDFKEEKRIKLSNSNCKLKILTKYILVTCKKDNSQFADIYDLLFFSQLASVKLPVSNIIEIFEDPKLDGFIFISTYEKFVNKILIFDLNAFSIIGFIQHPYDLLMVLNKKLIFQNKDKTICFIYSMNFDEIKPLPRINSMYLCKVQSFYRPYHLYKDPHILPCGNSACLECIYRGFNAYKKSYKCLFDSCKDEHKIPPNFIKIIKPDIKMEQSIKINCRYIAECLVNELFILQTTKGNLKIF